MSEKLKGLIIESPQIAPILARALTREADWFTISDHQILNDQLGFEMIEKNAGIVIFHVCKVQDEGPLNSVLEQGIPIVVVSRDEKVGGVTDLIPIYDRLRSQNVPMIPKNTNILPLIQLVQKVIRENT